MNNPLQKLSLLLYEALASIRASRCWLPLLLFWAVQVFLLLLLVLLLELPGQPWLSNWLARGFGPEAPTYPGFYLELPPIHGNIERVLAATLGVYLQGVSLLTLLHFHGRGRYGGERPWRRARSRWPGLLLLNLGLLLLTLGPLAAVRGWGPPLLPWAGPGPVLRAIAFLFGLAASLSFLYAPLGYLAFQPRLWRALTQSARFAGRHLGVSLGLVVIPYLLALGLGALSGLGRTLAEQWRPELALLVQILIALLIILPLFLQLSALVRFYVEQRVLQEETARSAAEL